MKVYDWHILCRCLDECVCGGYPGALHTFSKKICVECPRCGKHTSYGESWECMVEWNKKIRKEKLKE